MSRMTTRRKLIKDAVVPTLSPTSVDGNSTRLDLIGQLIKDVVAPTSNLTSTTLTTADGNSTASSSSSQQQLVLLGYDENDSPIYKKPCLSNDNDEPYKDNCTVSHIFGSSESYSYECTTEKYCNSHAPGNSHDLGWTFFGACDIILSCPDPYDEAKADKGEYVLGDQTMISSDYLDGNQIGSISCPGVSSNGEKSNQTVVLVPYVYEVETSQVSSADIFLPQLEENILLNLAGSMMNCASGRKLMSNNSWMSSIMQRFLSSDNVQCSAIGIKSRPEDVAVPGGACTITSAEADKCFLIKGSVTLLLDSIGDDAIKIKASILNATDTAQSNLQNAMNNDELLSPFLPEVIKVRYLGDSYEDNEISLSDVGGSKKERAKAWLWGPPIVALFLALIALLIVKRSRKKSNSLRSNNARALDSQDEGGDFDWEEWDLDFDDPKFARYGFGSGTNGKMIFYAGNLSQSTTKENVRELFEQHGTVLTCILPSQNDCRRGIDPPPRENDTGRFVLVAMPVASDTERAEAESARNNVDGTELDGYALRVREVTTLHVGNLSPMTTEPGLRGLFEQYGVVIGCTILPNPQGRGRYALVSMPDEDARNAIANLHGLKVDGSILSVRDIRRRSSMRNLMDDSFSTCNNEGDEKNSSGKLAALGATGAVVGGMLLRKKRKNRTESSDRNDQETDMNLDDDLDDIIHNIDGSTEGQDRRIFVVDPPGAFHLGKHHYTSDGVRYFSPLCQQCIAARADANGVVTLNAINADDDSNPDLTDANDLSFDLEAATKFTDFNCNDLGRCHSSIHVRQCKSTTCTTCQSQKEKGVYFVNSYL